MKFGFTLLELLVVIAIMGLMGTASVGGYRQMQRGMEERGVRDNVDQFVRNAYQRAQIDRVPTEIYCWNETLRERSDDENEIVVGRAVAVRRLGRISAVASGNGGALLIDEFGDFEQFDEDGEYADAPLQDNPIRLYQMGVGSSLSYSLVKGTPRTRTGKNTSGQNDEFVTHHPKWDTLDTSENKGTIIQYGYEVVKNVNATWKVGSAYGMEFLTLELPHGYIFGPSYSMSIDKPLEGEIKAVCKPDQGLSGTTIVIYSLRPGSSGMLEPKKIAAAEDPTKRLE